MLTITRQYKKGRAVILYDLTDALENKTVERVTKDEVVKQCENGQIHNAKIQWWEGKPIVRLQSANVPIVKIDDSGEIIGTAEKAVRGTNKKEASTPKEQKVTDVSSKGTVIGKINKSRISKESISYAGYDYRNIVEQQELSKSIDYSKIETLNDLFSNIALEFHLQRTEEYRNQISKKVNLDKKISSLQQSYLAAIQSSMATYMMNMAHDEINKTYIKYNVRA